MRILNGNLLVRTGGGYQDLLDALGKLPAPSSSSTPASPSPAAAAAAALTAANSVLAAAASISSPRTPVLSVGAGFIANSLSSEDQEGLQAQQQRSSSKCDSTSKQLHPHGSPLVATTGAAALAGAHPRLDLTNLHSSLYTRGSSGPLGSARTVDHASDAAGRSSGSAAAFEAAVQAAVAAAVEAAANAGLDDGMGTSGGGAAPAEAGAGSGATARQASRAALLGRVIAAKTAAGTLIEAGMCPPVPVQEEVGSPPAAAPTAALADTLVEEDSQSRAA